jgi:hypothetical protein
MTLSEDVTLEEFAMAKEQLRRCFQVVKVSHNPSACHVLHLQAA